MGKGFADWAWFCEDYEWRDSRVSCYLGLEDGGAGSPEELLAAAHASCYAMALSATLARKRTPPERLNVTAKCTFDKVGDGFKVTTMELTVRGKVPTLQASAFQEAAQAAEKACPISNAIRNNVEIKLSATLD